MKILLSIIGALAFIAVVCVLVSVAKKIVKILMVAFIIIYGGVLLIGGAAMLPEYINNKLNPESEKQQLEAKETGEKTKHKKVKVKKVKAKKIKIKKKKHEK